MEPLRLSKVLWNRNYPGLCLTKQTLQVFWGICLKMFDAVTNMVSKQSDFIQQASLKSIAICSVTWSSSRFSPRASSTWAMWILVSPSEWTCVWLHSWQFLDRKVCNRCKSVLDLAICLPWKWVAVEFYFHKLLLCCPGLYDYKAKFLQGFSNKPMLLC